MRCWRNEIAGAAGEIIIYLRQFRYFAGRCRLLEVLRLPRRRGRPQLYCHVKAGESSLDAACLLPAQPRYYTARHAGMIFIRPAAESTRIRRAQISILRFCRWADDAGAEAGFRPARSPG